MKKSIEKIINFIDENSKVIIITVMSIIVPTIIIGAIVYNNIKTGNNTHMTIVTTTQSKYVNKNEETTTTKSSIKEENDIDEITTTAIETVTNTTKSILITEEKNATTFYNNISNSINASNNIIEISEEKPTQPTEISSSVISPQATMLETTTAPTTTAPTTTAPTDISNTPLDNVQICHSGSSTESGIIFSLSKIEESNLPSVSVDIEYRNLPDYFCCDFNCVQRLKFHSLDESIITVQGSHWRSNTTYIYDFQPIKPGMTDVVFYDEKQEMQPLTIHVTVTE